MREIPRTPFVVNALAVTSPALSSEHAPRLSALPKDIAGAPIHAIGMVITLVLSVTTVANTMTAAMAGYKMFNAIRTLFSVGNHRFIPDLRGADLWLDSSLMHAGKGGAGDPADLADADAGPSSKTVKLFVPFTRPVGRAPEGAEYDGAIALAMLRDGDLKFTLGSGSDLGHAGVSYTFTSVTVDFVCEAIPHQLRVPTAWAIRRVSGASDGTLVADPRGHVYYAALFDPTIATPLIDPAIYGRVELSIGQGALPSQTIPQLMRTYAYHAAASLLGNDLLTVPSETAPQVVPLVAPAWGRLASRQPRGTIKVRLPDKTGSLSTEWGIVLRERGVRHDAYRRECYQRLGVGAGAQVEARASKKRAPDHLVPSLDETIRWPGMPFSTVEG